MTIRNFDPTSKPGTIDHEMQEKRYAQMYQEKHGVPYPGSNEPSDPDQSPKGYADETYR